MQIIELNGEGAEATSIYDARNSLWTAYRTLFRQWELVFAVGAANRMRGTKPDRLTLSGVRGGKLPSALLPCPPRTELSPCVL